MTLEATLTSKGQITIPKAVRDALRLDTGDTVYFDLQEDGSARLLPRHTPMEKLFGIIGPEAAAPR